MLHPSPHRQFHKDGYVIIRASLPLAMLGQLRIAASCIRRGKRAEEDGGGDWPHTTDPKHPLHGVWGINQVCNPNHNEEHTPLFLAYLVHMVQHYIAPLDSGGGGGSSSGGDGFSDASTCVPEGRCSSATSPAITPRRTAPNEFQLELCNLLTDPESDFVQDLHRDHVAVELEGEAELKEIQRQSMVKGGYQWNTALEDDDDCLVFVPGSHDRPRTQEELTLLQEEGAKTTRLGNVIVLNQGDSIIYDANGLHRGQYLVSQHRRKEPQQQQQQQQQGSVGDRSLTPPPPPWRRATLHFCVGHAMRHGVQRIPMMYIFDAIEYTKTDKFKEAMAKAATRGAGDDVAVLLLLQALTQNLLESEDRAKLALGLDTILAAVDAHNNRSDVKKDGLVGEKCSKL
jgi:hypothetical protein